MQLLKGGATCPTQPPSPPQKSLPNPIHSCSSHQRSLGRRRARAGTLSSRATVQCASTASADPLVADTQQVAAVVAAAAAAVPLPTTCVPEDLELAPGQLSTIDRVGKCLDVDTFRCFGCVKEECKVSGWLRGAAGAHHKLRAACAHLTHSGQSVRTVS
jgi:hypothetical protein